MCMNTFGILPDVIRDGCLRQMFTAAGTNGMVVIGCWDRDSMRTGY